MGGICVTHHVCREISCRVVPLFFLYTVAHSHTDVQSILTEESPEEWSCLERPGPPDFHASSAVLASYRAGSSGTAVAQHLAPGSASGCLSGCHLAAHLGSHTIPERYSDGLPARHYGLVRGHGMCMRLDDGSIALAK